MASASSSFRTEPAIVASLRMVCSTAPVCSSLRTDPGACDKRVRPQKARSRVLKGSRSLLSSTGTKVSFHMESFKAQESSVDMTA